MDIKIRAGYHLGGPLSILFIDEAYDWMSIRDGSLFRLNMKLRHRVSVKFYVEMWQ